MTDTIAVDVVVDVPRLELDRPFTYLLAAEHAPGTGLLVSVPFHGRTVRAWVLGPAAEVPSRVLPVRRVLSRVPLLDTRLLELGAWMRERYVAPLATVLDRMVPPRVAGEEETVEGPDEEMPPPAPASGALRRYEGGEELLASMVSSGGAFVVRPLPGREAEACVEAVAACVAAGRTATVIVPEAKPLPATAEAVREAFPDAVLFLAGDRRSRYRTWLRLLRGRHRVVIGTRPAVFAPSPRPGLLWVHREAHPGHREERSPYYHVRDVALASARLAGATAVLSGLAHSVEASALVERGDARAVVPPRGVERSSAPLVETTKPGREDRSPRLTQLLRSAEGAFLLLSREGYGVARVCRRCGEPVRCALCSGPAIWREDRIACGVCGAEVRCPACGSASFGVERGGTERLEEWVRRLTSHRVRRVEAGERAVAPRRGGVIVGTSAAVKELAGAEVPLVAVLDPDRARRRPGLNAPVQSLATWMEAAAWAGPRAGGGRVLVQTSSPSDPAVQALVRWDPAHLHRAERRRREEAGFPPGFPVFRVAGRAQLADRLAELRPVTLLSSGLGDEAVCLVTLRPDAVARFRERVLAWAEEGTVSRVEAEPQL